MFHPLLHWLLLYHRGWVPYVKHDKNDLWDPLSLSSVDISRARVHCLQSHGLKEFLSYGDSIGDCKLSFRYWKSWSRCRCSCSRTLLICRENLLLLQANFSAKGTKQLPWQQLYALLKWLLVYECETHYFALSSSPKHTKDYRCYRLQAKCHQDSTLVHKLPARGQYTCK